MAAASPPRRRVQFTHPLALARESGMLRLPS
jgi:hypothetical protein